MRAPILSHLQLIAFSTHGRIICNLMCVLASTLDIFWEDKGASQQEKANTSQILLTKTNTTFPTADHLASTVDIFLRRQGSALTRVTKEKQTPQTVTSWLRCCQILLNTTSTAVCRSFGLLRIEFDPFSTKLSIFVHLFPCSLLLCHASPFFEASYHVQRSCENLSWKGFCQHIDSCQIGDCKMYRIARKYMRQCTAVNNSALLKRHSRCGRLILLSSAAAITIHNHDSQQTNAATSAWSIEKCWFSWPPT